MPMSNQKKTASPKKAYCPYISETFKDKKCSPSMFPFFTLHVITIIRGVFSMDVLGDLAPKIFGHLIIVGKN